MIHLIVTLKGRTVGRFDVESERVRIGRHPENEVQIDNMSVSRFHCMLEHGADGRWTVEDQGSHNGTFLNGAKTGGRAQLNDGDTLGVGQFQVAVRTDERTAAHVISVRSNTAPRKRELLATEKGFLLRENSHGGPLPLTRDLFQLGSLPGCDLLLPGPRKQALIVRGQGGFQLVNVAEEAGVTCNGQVVPDTAWLSDGDKLQVGELTFSFHLGLPPDEEADQSTMEINIKDLPPGLSDMLGR